MSVDQDEMYVSLQVKVGINAQAHDVRSTIKSENVAFHSDGYIGLSTVSLPQHYA